MILEQEGVATIFTKEGITFFVCLKFMILHKIPYASLDLEISKNLKKIHFGIYQHLKNGNKIGNESVPSRNILPKWKKIKMSTSVRSSNKTFFELPSFRSTRKISNSKYFRKKKAFFLKALEVY